DEGWHAWVLDFGLARETAATGLTQTGICMGSPPYMAPEQARGEIRQLDRRTDVYALGAVLYELLAGQPPFAGESTVELLLKVLSEEPQPLRRLDPRIPADLETVVLKCLEKEPQRRYDSARALAEDLGRYLDGEPVQARRSSLVYRVSRRARKHRVAVTAAAMGVVAMAALLGLWLHARWSAAEQATLAQRFGQQVEGIESTLRQSYLLPLHDTRPERARVRARMEAIEAQIAMLGDGGRGPGHYALGRGYLALRQYAQARVHLEEAWKAGYHTPDARVALGRVLGALYGEALEALPRVPKAQRERRRLEVERTLRDPALVHLKSITAATDEPAAYVRGLVAYYERRYADALASLKRATVEAPAFYEARLLAGKVFMTQGNDHAAHGDYAGALTAYELAAGAFAAAREVARSDPEPATSDCGRQLSVQDAQLVLGSTERGPLDGALAACRAAAQADPDDALPYAFMSEGWWRWAEYESARGLDSRASTQRGIEMGREALRRDPRNVIALDGVATALGGRADEEQQNGGDPEPAFREATALFRRALAVEPENVPTLNNLSGLYEEIAMYELARGIDPGATLDRAVEAAERAIAIAPTITAPLNNLALVHWTRASDRLARGLDPTQPLALARGAARRALAINASSAYAHQGLVQADLEAARWELARGADPRPLLRSAASHAQRALEINPEFPDIHASLGVAAALEAEYLLAVGSDPTPPLRQGRGRFAAELRLNAKSADAYLGSGRLELVAARWALRRGSSPEPAVAVALEAVRRMAAWSAPQAELHLLAAAAQRWRAEGMRIRGGDIAAETTRGLVEADRALALNPRLAEAMAVKGALELLQARVVAAPGARPAAAESAVGLLQRAFAIDPLLRRDYEPLLAEAKDVLGGAT
ncbi:MAG TPA: protein kinase, partial [Thermoanaerobaculia bacterium]|nr:protein kinase [Thermoanaerobaculia bacterium]